MSDYPLTWHRATKAKRPKKATPEGLVLKAIKAYLILCRIGAVHRQQVGVARYGEHGQQVVPYGELGASDLRVDLAGEPRSIFVEVKAPNGRVSPHQEAYLERQRSRGHVAFVARSVQEVYEQLTAAGFKVPKPSPRPGARRAA